MAGDTHEDSQLPTLASAISNLRKELQLAHDQASQEQYKFDIKSVTLELQVLAVKKGKGQIGFTVPVLGLSAGIEGAVERTRTHTVRIELGVPPEFKVLDVNDQPYR